MSGDKRLPVKYDGLSPSLRKQIGALARTPHPKTPVDPRMATGRTHCNASTTAPYVPERGTHYRNDGHKHIKSRGTGC